MEKRAHADRCVELPSVLVGADIDLMIEVCPSLLPGPGAVLNNGSGQAKDKEQAVFHLYRIYGLEDVIHENLRPEKPPKPFVRGPGSRARGKGADGDEGEDDGEDAAEAVDATPKRRTRAKAKSVDDVGLAAQGEVEAKLERAGEAAQTKPQPKRRRATTGGAATPEEPKPSKRKRTFKGKAAARAEELVNQEDDPEPVDGARVSDVEADEHPEVVRGDGVETVRDEAQECRGEDGGLARCS